MGAAKPITKKVGEKNFVYVCGAWKWSSVGYCTHPVTTYPTGMCPRHRKWKKVSSIELWKGPQGSTFKCEYWEHKPTEVERVRMYLPPNE